MDFDSFAIGFDHRDRERLHELWDSVLDSERWSEGDLTARFEAAWSEWSGVPAVARAPVTARAAARGSRADMLGSTVTPGPGRHQDTGKYAEQPPNWRPTGRSGGTHW